MHRMSIGFLVDGVDVEPIRHTPPHASYFAVPRAASPVETWRHAVYEPADHPSTLYGDQSVSDHFSDDAYKPYGCLVCGKHFAKARYLTQHKLVHSDVKPHVCNNCGAGFKRSCELQLHTMVHSDAKPFRCKICPAAFKSSQNLKQHGQTHSEERPFECPECRAAFKRGSTLKRHRIQEHAYV